MKDKESADEAQLPFLPFDPRVVGPLDLLRAGVGRVTGFCSRNSRELLAAGTIIILAQMVLYAQYDVVFLQLPQLPNWMLVGIGGVIFMSPTATLLGVLLAKGLYKPNTVALSVQNPQTGDQRIKHLARERFENCRIVDHNEGVKDRTYLAKVSINGLQAFEVDRFDEENNVLVASSMAGRTNSEVRADRLNLREIKTTMERKVNEAEELKIRFPDLVRDAAMKIANRVIRTTMDVELPDGADLHDELQDAIKNVESYEELYEPDDRDDDGEESEERDKPGTKVDLNADENLVGIFAEAEKNGGSASEGGTPADD